MSVIVWLLVILVIAEVWRRQVMEKRRGEQRDFEDRIATMRQLHSSIMSGNCTSEDVERFEEAYSRTREIMDRVPKAAGGLFIADDSLRAEIERLKDQIMFRGAAGKMHSATFEIERLAELRRKGMISDDEFKAFSERFKVSTGEKAKTIIQAINDLHVQFRNGAMSEGNYHSTLWSLLDKLDRKT